MMLQYFTGILRCLHCVFILLRGVCSVGGLHFPQHTVISLLGGFPRFIMGVPSWSTSRVLCPSEESRPKKIQIRERRQQQCTDGGWVHSNLWIWSLPIFALCNSRLRSYLLFLHHCSIREGAVREKGFFLSVWMLREDFIFHRFYPEWKNLFLN